MTSHMLIVVKNSCKRTLSTPSCAAGWKIRHKVRYVQHLNTKSVYVAISVSMLERQFYREPDRAFYSHVGNITAIQVFPSLVSIVVAMAGRQFA
jgi:hypothetical protein